jgi:hypothetical protein
MSKQDSTAGICSLYQLARRLARCVVLRLERKSTKLRSDKRIQVVKVPWPENVKGIGCRYRLSYETTERETFVTIERSGSPSDEVERQSPAPETP